MLIDKSIATPYYLQISNYIRNEINSGVYADGQMMPSEQEMQEKFDVSRITIRKAYKVLTNEGILNAIKGKGTYVNIRNGKDWTNMNSFTREIIASGHVPSTQIINFEVIKANEFIASNLNVKVGTKCYYLNRLRYIDEKAIWLTKTYILCSTAPGLTPEHFSHKGVGQSIYHVLEANYGITFKIGPTISIQNQASDQDAELLRLDKNEPVICKAMIVSDDTDRAIIYETTYFDQSINANLHCI